MLETDNAVRQKDIEEIVQDKILENFADKTVFVTGATGLIGSETIFALLCANRLKNLNIKIVALGRSQDKMNSVFKNVINNKNLEFIVQDIQKPINYDKNVDYIIHTASMTSSKMMALYPIECAKTTILGTLNFLEFAKAKEIKSFLYLSSIEIYGKTDNNLADIKENDYGCLDSLNPRNSYSLGKKTAENFCASYNKEFNLPVKIARLTQTFGAGISETENRVFAQFAKSALNKEDIILHTDGSSYKNYCYLTDAIRAMFTILIKGKNNEAYNVANYDTGISIKDMALMMANKYGVTLRIENDGQDRGYNDIIKIKLNSNKLEQLGWQPTVSLENMFDRLIKSLKK